MPDGNTLLIKAAVLEQMAKHPAIQALIAWDAEALTNAKFDRGELTLTIQKEQIRQACEIVRTAGYNAFQTLTAVDWYPASPRFQVTYHILSHSYKEILRLSAMVDESDAAIGSVTPVWAGANYYEREVFDLFGIRFEGHPNLRRILMPDEWVGHPLRKDYPVEGYR